jgi:leucyl aminopeptidase (aminopeptidase T)
MSVFGGLFELVDLRPDDQMVIVSDSRSDESIARIVFDEALARDADTTWAHVRARDRNGDELPGSVRAAIQSTDLVVLLTSWSPSHSAGVIEAMARGARIMSMPGFTSDLVGRGAMTADYGEVKALTDLWGEHLARGRSITVTTSAGTELEAELGGWSRLPLLDGGPLPRGIGGLGNFPAGEAAISPIEGTARGRVVVDMTSSTTRTPLAAPIVLTLEDGTVVEIEGGEEAAALERFLDDAGESARVVAEIALGTNPRALHVGVMLEDEKRLGTAHVGLGNATGFGGLNESPVHVDGVFSAATAIVDDVPLLVDGEIAIECYRREALGDLSGRHGVFTPGTLETEVRNGMLYVCWREARGFPVWSQVGDDDAARAAAALFKGEPLQVSAGTEDAVVADLLERYRVIVGGGATEVELEAGTLHFGHGKRAGR